MTAVMTSSPTGARTRVAGKQTFLRAVAAEWIKIRTLNSTWITSVITLLCTAGIGVPLVIVASENSQNPWVGAVYGVAFGQIVVSVLGAMVVTGEYSSGQIRSSLAAIPSRSRLFFSKMLMVALWSFGMGVLSMLLTWVVSIPFLKNPSSPFNGDALSVVWGTGLCFAGIAIMSAALGFLLRSTAGTITIVTLLLFVVQIPLQLAAMKWRFFEYVSEALPSNVTQHVADPFGLTTGGGVMGAVLTHTQCQLIFAAWVIIPLLLAWLVFSKRDA